MAGAARNVGRKRDRIGLLIDDNTYKNSHYRAGFLDVVALNSQTPLVYNSGSILIGPCWMSRRARASSSLTEMSYVKCYPQESSDVYLHWIRILV